MLLNSSFEATSQLITIRKVKSGQTSDLVNISSHPRVKIKNLLSGFCQIRVTFEGDDWRFTVD